MNTAHILVAVLLAAHALGCEEKRPTAAPAPPAPTPPAAATAPTVTPPATESAGPRVSAMGLSFQAPAGWKPVPPANSMRLAEMQVPDPSGDPAQGCTVAFSSAGGDVAANIDRWTGQVRDGAGEPGKPVTSERTVAGHKVTTVELTGAYTGMGESPRTDWTLRGAIVETPRGLLFIKMTGPAAAMARTKPAFEAMVDGMRE